MNQSKFNFNGKALFLTYESWLTKSDLIQIFKKYNVRYSAVNESADERHPYKHTHVLVWFIKKTHIRECRALDLGNIHPHIKKVLTRKHWQHLINVYIKKETKPFISTLIGTEHEYLGNLRQLIQSCKSWSEVINNDNISPQIMKHMGWAREVFNNKPNLHKYNLIEDYGSFLPWQTEVVNKLMKQGKRECLWICDVIGNQGKSELSDHLEDNNGALVIEGGKSNDIAYLWQGQDIIIFDLPRCRSEYVPYTSIEGFKKGRMNSYKYVPVRKRYQPCKVVIFANHLPNTTETLSIDRWEILLLDKGKLIPFDSTESVVPQVLNIKRDIAEEVKLSVINYNNEHLYQKSQYLDWIDVNKNNKYELKNYINPPPTKRVQEKFNSTRSHIILPPVPGGRVAKQFEV